MRFSIWPNAGHPVTEQLDLARWADDHGALGIWFADHYMPNTGDTSFTPGEYHECWGLLPAAAAVTSRVRVGTLVSPTTVHHPAVLANRAATIDHVSNGRMVLGLGAGWQINEHHAYGIDLLEPGPRVTRFGESIRIVRSLLSEGRTDFDGEWFRITDAPCDPKPIQSPLPLLVGTSSPRMLRFTANYADEWNTWGNVDVARQKHATFVAACETAGVDPATKRCSVNALVEVDGTSDAGNVLAGSAEQLVDMAGQLADIGFDEFIVPNWNLGDSPEARAERLDELHAKVLSSCSG